MEATEVDEAAAEDAMKERETLKIESAPMETRSPDLESRV